MTEKIEEKLDVLIKLAAASLIKDDKTKTESILKLKNIGLRNKDISKIINNTENYIKMVLSRSKNANKK